jgi:hypothetical protein
MIDPRVRTTSLLAALAALARPVPGGAPRDTRTGRPRLAGRVAGALGRYARGVRALGGGRLVVGASQAGAPLVPATSCDPLAAFDLSNMLAITGLDGR